MEAKTHKPPSVQTDVSFFFSPPSTRLINHIYPCICMMNHFSLSVSPVRSNTCTSLRCNLQPYYCCVYQLHVQYSSFILTYISISSDQFRLNIKTFKVLKVFQVHHIDSTGLLKANNSVILSGSSESWLMWTCCCRWSSHLRACCH